MTVTKGTTTPDEANAPTGFIMFLGLANSHALFAEGREPQAQWIDVTEAELAAERLHGGIDGQLGREMLYFSYKMYRKLKWCAPGAVYKITRTTEGVRYTPKQAPVGRIQLLKAQQHYALAHEAVVRDWEVLQRIKKGTQTRMDRTMLIPFRDAYTRLNGAQRAIFIADLVSFITRGS